MGVESPVNKRTEAAAVPTLRNHCIARGNIGVDGRRDESAAGDVTRGGGGGGSGCGGSSRNSRGGRGRAFFLRSGGGGRSEGLQGGNPAAPTRSQGQGA